jgi:NTE family protein
MKPLPTDRPVVGLALGGGGARGIPHLGVLRTLERAGIPIDLVAGTSIGALLGGVYAAGYSAEVMCEEALRLGKMRHLAGFVDWWPSLSGQSGRPVMEYLQTHIGPNRSFSELNIPFAVMAVDLHRGEVVALREGYVVEAQRASMSVPGVFKPVEIMGRRLIDGGVLNNVPADVARQMGADVVIAVDVMPKVGAGLAQSTAQEMSDGGGWLAFTPMVTDLWETLVVVMAQNTAKILAQAKPEVVIRPTIPDSVSLFVGFHRVAELIAVGEEATTAVLPQIHAAIAQKQT